MWTTQNGQGETTVNEAGLLVVLWAQIAAVTALDNTTLIPVGALAVGVAITAKLIWAVATERKELRDRIKILEGIVDAIRTNCSQYPECIERTQGKLGNGHSAKGETNG
jgi:hypothetical protein